MSDVNKVLDVVFFARNRNGDRGIPAIFWGLSGVGKSAIIQTYAKQWNTHCQILSPGEHGEGAFGVTPVPVGNGSIDKMRIGYPMPSWVDEFDMTGNRGLLFVDEMSATRDMQLQAACLAMVNDKRVGGAQLPKGVRVIGAANPPEYAANGFELSAPLANRLLHLDWEMPTPEAWSSYMLAAGSEDEKPRDVVAEEARVDADWGGAYARVVGPLVAFARARPALFHAQPKPGTPDAGRAWPSPRSWDLAARAATSCAVQGASSLVTDMMIASAVGAKAATEFVAFRKAADLPDPSELLDGKISWKHDPTRLDRSHAVFAACGALVADKHCASRTERVERLWALSDSVSTTAPDVALAAIEVIAQPGVGDSSSDAAIRVLAKMRPLLSASGYRRRA